MKTTIFPLFVSIWLVATGALRAASVVSEVTPTRLEAAGFTFAITPERLPDGTVKFRIVVTEATARFSSNASTALGAVEISDHSQSVRPERRLNPERHEHSLVSTFSVDKAALKDRAFCFVFANYVERVMDGKKVYMPSADIVYARLKDFAPPQP